MRLDVGGKVSWCHPALLSSVPCASPHALHATGPSTSRENGTGRKVSGSLRVQRGILCPNAAALTSHIAILSSLRAGPAAHPPCPPPLSSSSSCRPIFDARRSRPLSPPRRRWRARALPARATACSRVSSRLRPRRGPLEADSVAGAEAPAESSPGEAARSLAGGALATAARAGLSAGACACGAATAAGDAVRASR